MHIVACAANVSPLQCRMSVEVVLCSALPWLAVSMKVCTSATSQLSFVLCHPWRHKESIA